MRMLIVCTQNTCRSPMLESMLNAYIKENNIKGIDVVSAGIMGDKSPISEECEKVLKSHNIPFINRVSKCVDKKLIDSVDIIFTMTEEHKNYIEINFDTNVPIKTLSSLNGGDILDPYGMGIGEYENTYQIFSKMLKDIVEIIK